MNPLIQTTFFGYPSNTYWVITFNSFRLESIETDGSENIYLAGHDLNAGGESVNIQIFNYNQYGSIKWQRSIGSSVGDLGPQLSRGSDGSIYISARTTWNPTNTYTAASIKYNSSGVLQWQRRLTGYTGTASIGVAVDSSGNQYYSGYTDVGGGNSNYQALFYKRNSSGTLQWQRIFGTSSSPGGQDFPKNLVIDNYNNYVYIQYSTYVGGTRSYIAKYNTSGTLQWQQYVTHYSSRIAMDSDGYIYLVGIHSSGNPFILKFDSSGTTQWCKTLGCSGRYIGITTYADGIYCIGIRGSYPNTAFLMTKYNLSGTLQWQRELSYSGRYFLPEIETADVKVDSRGNIYYCDAIYSPSSNYISMFMKLPIDGSKIGTYGNYTITQTSYSDSSISLSLTTDGIGDSAGPMSESANSWTDSAASWSPTFTSI